MMNKRLKKKLQGYQPKAADGLPKPPKGGTGETKRQPTVQEAWDIVAAYLAVKGAAVCCFVKTDWHTKAVEIHLAGGEVLVRSKPIDGL